MKLIHLSIAAILGLCSTALGADTLQDAFKNGKFSGIVNLMHTNGNDTDVAAAKASDNRYDASIGMRISYVTDSFYSFKLGIGFESAHDLGIHNYDGSSEDDARNTISATILQQAYLQYNFMKSNIKVGRQIISTPLLSTSKVFPMEDYFDGITITTKDIPDTLLMLMYVKEWGKRFGSDSNGMVAQENTHYPDGLYSIYVKNSSINGLTLDGQFLTNNKKGNNGDPAVSVVDGYKTYFAQALYKLPIAYPLSLGALYGGANFDTPVKGKDSTTFYGAKVESKIGEVALMLGYTKVSDDADFPGTLGHAPDKVMYTNGLINKANYAGLEAVALEGKYNFGIKELDAALKLIYFDQSDNGLKRSVIKIGEAKEANLDIKYEFSGILKGFSTRANMGYAKYNQNVSKDYNTYSQLYLTYKF